jgi:hypothetical protein
MYGVNELWLCVLLVGFLSFSFFGICVFGDKVVGVIYRWETMMLTFFPHNRVVAVLLAFADVGLLKVL